jgi:S-adenosylmethionine decarboxylase
LNEENKYWGYHLTVNASNLDAEKIRSIEVVTQFFKDLCEHIKMTPYGEPHVVRFGKDPFVSGISGFQLIEESNCNCHLVEQNNSGYFDVFSCCPFDTDVTIKFILDYLGTDRSKYNSNFEKRLAP